MAKRRKTITLDRLIEYANGYLAADFQGGDSATARARRKGLIDLLEHALIEAGQYRVIFVYLDEDVITKSKPGIRWKNDREDCLVDTDSTRRRYV